MTSSGTPYCRAMFATALSRAAVSLSLPALPLEMNTSASAPSANLPMDTTYRRSPTSSSKVSASRRFGRRRRVTAAPDAGASRGRVSIALMTPKMAGETAPPS